MPCQGVGKWVWGVECKPSISLILMLIIVVVLVCWAQGYF
jgi:hypothetical protein